MSTTIEKILHELESRGRVPFTPLYIVSEEILKDNIDAMNRAFFSRFDRFILGYSYKTNYAKDVLRMVHQEGGYAEVVSPMELAHARTFVDDSKIIYNGGSRDVVGQVELADHVGVCLDTCHVWDGGYDVAGRLDDVLEEFDRVIGLERLRAVHLNDSKNPLGAVKDRHARLGEGEIGFEALAAVTNHEALRGLPFFLETPQDDLAGWGAEIAALKAARL